jgi:hypothetical protein
MQMENVQVKMVELLQQVETNLTQELLEYMALKDVMAILTSEASESRLFFWALGKY